MKAQYKSSSDTARLSGERGIKSGGSKKRNILIGVVVVLILAAVIGVIVYFTAFHDQASGTTTISNGGKGAGQGGDDVTTTATGETTTAESQTTTQAPAPSPGLRVDCLPDLLSKTKAKCSERSCQWDDSAVDNGDKCFTVSRPDVGFMVSGNQDPDPYTTLINITWKGDEKSNFRSVDSTSNNRIKNVQVQIFKQSNQMLRIKMIDRENSRYEVPGLHDIKPASGDNADFDILFSNSGEKFSFKVTRKSDGTVIFDTSVADIIMEDQYLSLSTKTPTKNVYGFGENLHRTFRHQFKETETWPALARDQPPGQDPNLHNENLYGVHPFYVCIEDGGNAHGVLLYNSNPQDFTLSPGGMITYRTIGGIFDFFIFTGPTPENVIQQYTGLIGRPYMPPYWSLGFQLCRYGYKNTSHIKEAVDRTRDALIPHDVQYADIDYMDARKDFTIDQENFGDMPQYFKELRSNYSMKTIIILDPALSIQDGYDVYPQGKAKNIYIKWPKPEHEPNYQICEGCRDDEFNMLGYVWPDNKTVFPDFFKKNTQDLWKEWIVNQSKEIEFDGLWIDMNEPANFDTNKDKIWNWEKQRPGEPFWSLKCDMNNTYENPPYKTKACHLYEGQFSISDKTLCMVGKQGENDEYIHYDVHNLYGWSQSLPTLEAMRAVIPDKRGMVISRSTFPGSGKYVGHWLGDNSADWQHLRDSIIGMLEFNLFGIPYVGADICGFFGNTTVELCKRWMQLGAFYPFARNHNGIGYIDHDPAAFSDRSVAILSKSSLETRYRMLPYLYTLFYKANTRGDTVVRSLQFEFSSDSSLYDISEQFLWGDKVMFAPILYESQSNVSVKFPKARWYDYYERMRVSDGGDTQSVAVDGNSEIPIYIRGGSVLVMKNPALTTTESRKTPFHLIVALDVNGTARGDLYWDDGESIFDLSDGSKSIPHCLINFVVEQKKLTVTAESSSCTEEDAGDKSLTIITTIIMGVEQEPSNVTLSGTDVLVSSYNVTKQALIIEGTDSMAINTDFFIEWN